MRLILRIASSSAGYSCEFRCLPTWKIYIVCKHGSQARHESKLSAQLAAAHRRIGEISHRLLSNLKLDPVGNTGPFKYNSQIHESEAGLSPCRDVSQAEWSATIEMNQRLAFLRSTLWLPRNTLMGQEASSNLDRCASKANACLSLDQLKTASISRTLTVEAVVSGLNGTSEACSCPTSVSTPASTPELPQSALI